MSSSSDEASGLSAASMAALRMHGFEGLQELEMQMGTDAADRETTWEEDELVFKADWQLSQFWYTEETAERLAAAALAACVAAGGGVLACVAAPTCHRALRKLELPVGVQLRCLEVDTRFDRFGEQFVKYDLNTPLKLPPALLGAVACFVLDPPFLSEVCLAKVAVTVKACSKPSARVGGGDCAPVLLCTGETMEERAWRLLGCSDQHFLVEHEKTRSNLTVPFRLFANVRVEGAGDAPAATAAVAGTVSVKLFASGRELAECGGIELALAEAPDTAALVRVVQARFPRLTDEWLASTLLSLNCEYLGRGTVSALSDGDEVAFIPPISGG